MAEVGWERGLISATTKRPGKIRVWMFPADVSAKPMALMRRGKIPQGGVNISQSAKS